MAKRLSFLRASPISIPQSTGKYWQDEVLVSMLPGLLLIWPTKFEMLILSGTPETLTISYKTRKSPLMTDYFVHESSYLDEGAVVGPGTKIWHFCHILTGAHIGAWCSLGQNVCVSSNVGDTSLPLREDPPAPWVFYRGQCHSYLRC